MLGRLLLAASLAACANASSAHDFWLNKQKVDPVTKNFCCGADDCRQLPKDQVKVEQQGYLLLDTGEIVGFSRAQPSPDGQYWVCRWGRGTAGGPETKCFFSGELF